MVYRGQRGELERDMCEVRVAVGPHGPTDGLRTAVGRIPTLSRLRSVHAHLPGGEGCRAIAPAAPRGVTPDRSHPIQCHLSSGFLISARRSGRFSHFRVAVQFRSVANLLRSHCIMNRWPLAITCLGLGILVGLVASQKLVGQPAVPVLPDQPPCRAIGTHMRPL